MEKLTREQINRKLEILRRSKNDEESYFTTRPSMAMCYSMSPPSMHTVKRYCECCGKEFEISWRDYSRTVSVEDLESIAESFLRAGMDAKAVCHCPECVGKQGKHAHEIWLKSREESDWHVSLPEAHEQGGNEDVYTTTFEYELALKFLTASEENHNFLTLTYRGLNRDEYVHYSSDAGFIKLQTDVALYKVFGFNITYDMEEMKNDLSYLYSSHNHIAKVRLHEALKMLEESGKESFTVLEFRALAKKIFYR